MSDENGNRVEVLETDDGLAVKIDLDADSMSKEVKENLKNPNPKFFETWRDMPSQKLLFDLLPAEHHRILEAGLKAAFNDGFFAGGFSALKLFQQTFEKAGEKAVEEFKLKKFAEHNLATGNVN